MQFALSFTAFLAVGVAVAGAQPVERPQDAVKRCIEVVRKTRSFEWFDAYYNPGTKRVEDNVNNLQVAARIPFRSCMAEQGFPLESLK